MLYLAHKTNDDREQSIKEHLTNTACLAENNAVDVFKPFAYLIGYIHDIGKYANDFQKRIKGNNIRFEHAICGAIELHRLISSDYDRLIMPMLEYCIAGHHTGLPDGGSSGSSEDDSELQGRLKRSKYYTGTADYSAYKEEIQIDIPDSKELINLLMDGLKPGDTREAVERYAFFTRYLFSCLTDADFLDTEKFFDPDTDRKLHMDLDSVIGMTDSELEKLNGSADTDLQKARKRYLEKAVQSSKSDEEIYLLNMPTGSGKTMCSLKTALELLKRSNGRLKRIIYVIPYTSIIEQTADKFTELFGQYADILQHHSNYFYDDKDDEFDTLRKLQLASENWDSPFVITTSVQFFQSLYHCKSSGLRKLHNMAESVIVFDEIHLLPLEVLQPCLRGVGYITKYLHSKALFLSATLPDYSRLFDKYVSGCRYKELITDKSDLKYFKKCRYIYLGDTDQDNIVCKAQEQHSSLIVVNSRKSAREIYSKISGNKYHLSTYMTPKDRSETIEKIRRDLQEHKQITVVSTSLIEAGVDLDFETVFRQLAGLDSILQSGGRCNREGRNDDAKVYVFKTDETAQGELSLRTEITEGLIKEYEEISSIECINEYYDRLFYNRDSIIERNSIKDYSGEGMDMIAFRTYSQDFELIKDDTVAVIINNCDEAQKYIDSYFDDPKAARRNLQRYSVALKYKSEFIPMLETGRIEEKYQNLYVLNDNNDYSALTGLMIDKTNDYIG